MHLDHALVPLRVDRGGDLRGLGLGLAGDRELAATLFAVPDDPRAAVAHGHADLADVLRDRVLGHGRRIAGDQGADWVAAGWVVAGCPPAPSPGPPGGPPPPLAPGGGAMRALDGSSAVRRSTSFC